MKIYRFFTYEVLDSNNEFKKESKIKLQTSYTFYTLTEEIQFKEGQIM